MKPMKTTIEPEPFHPADTPRLAQLYFEAIELCRHLAGELAITERVYGRGRRRDVLNRSMVVARRLVRVLAPLAGIE